MQSEAPHPIQAVSRAAILILLIAFALRVFQLDNQSLWYDEGLSVQLASLPLHETIAQSAATDHPPLHTLILNIWIRIAGSSEFAVRYVSVFLSTLAVALTYVFARRIGTARVGWFAAALISIAPMAIWYGQETRGYSLLVVCVLIAMLAFMRLLDGDTRRRIWLTYILACAAAMYTHYFAAFSIVAFNVVFSLIWIVDKLSKQSRSGVALRNWLLAQFAIVALFLPWLPNALAQAQSNATYFPGRVTWDTVLVDTWQAFANGSGAFSGGSIGTLPPTNTLWLALLFLGLVGLLLRLTATPHHPHTQISHSHVLKRILTLVALLIVPILLMALLAWERPKFAPRYLLPSLPVFMTLAALGIATLLRFRNRWLAVTILLPLLLIPAIDMLAIARIYFDAPAARPDVRAVAAYIEAHDGAHDAILLVGGHQAPVFEYYYAGRTEIIALPPSLLPAAQSPVDLRVLPQLANVAATHERAWLVLWQREIADPANIILSELRSQAQRLEVGERFHDMSLLLFDLRDAAFAVAPQHNLDIRFVEPIRLVGFDLESNQIDSSQDIEFTLYFESLGSLDRNYQVFTHLITLDGQIMAQDDRIAGADSFPTSLWKEGTRLRNTFNIHLPDELVSGEYQIVVGLYDDAGRLKLSGGADAIDLETIVIDSP